MSAGYNWFCVIERTPWQDDAHWAAIDRGTARVALPAAPAAQRPKADAARARTSRAKGAATGLTVPRKN